MFLNRKDLWQRRLIEDVGYLLKRPEEMREAMGGRVCNIHQEQVDKIFLQLLLRPRKIVSSCSHGS